MMAEVRVGSPLSNGGSEVALLPRNRNLIMRLPVPAIFFTGLGLTNNKQTNRSKAEDMLDIGGQSP